MVGGAVPCPAARFLAEPAGTSDPASWANGQQPPNRAGGLVRKIMTVTLEFDLGDRRMFPARLRAGSVAAASAATEALKQELLEGSIGTVRTRMSYDYRWAEASSEQPSDTEWENEEGGPGGGDPA
jgi:hypothetical protein